MRMKIIILKKYENSIGSEGLLVERPCVEEVQGEGV